MNVLELFCGTRSFSNVAQERGHKTFGVDKDERFDPDCCIDMLYFHHTAVPFKPDIIWASPPCTCFSIASVSHHFNMDRTPKSLAAQQSVALVEKTLILIEKLRPKFWFIENPRGLLRKMEIMQVLRRVTTTYCQYGDTRMKPTDIWTNTSWTPRPMCNNGDPCHEKAPRGSRTGTQGLKNNVERGRVPRELCEEIIKYCEVNIEPGN